MRPSAHHKLFRISHFPNDEGRERPVGTPGCHHRRRAVLDGRGSRKSVHNVTRQRRDTMRRFVTKQAIGLGLAGAIALATPLAAAPMMSNGAALNTAVPTSTEQIRWRGHNAWVPGAVIGGLAAGAIIGSQVANPYYGGYAYDPYPYAYGSYGYARPYYRGGYGFYDPDCVGEYDSAGV